MKKAAGRPRVRFAEIQDRPVREGRRSAGQHRREAEADRIATAGNPAQTARTRSRRCKSPPTPSVTRSRRWRTRRKFQLETEAAGAASATKATGFAGADVVEGHRSRRSRREQGARSGRGLRHRGAGQGDRRGDAREGRIVQAIQRGRRHRNDRARDAGNRGQDQRAAVARPRRWSSSTPATGPAAARAS